MAHYPNVAQQRRCACTLPFSLHLTVMILGIVGMILGVVAEIIIFRIANFWPLISGALAFASGLQGILVHPGSGCFNCHVVLAVINLVNLGVFGIACLFLISPFWIIWAIAGFAMELWVTIARFCCQKYGGEGGVAGSTELPVAQPGVVHVVHGHPAASQAPSYVGYDHRFQGNASEPQGGYKQPYMP